MFLRLFGSNTVGYISVALDSMIKNSQRKINPEEWHLQLQPPHHQLYLRNLLHPILELDVFSVRRAN